MEVYMAWMYILKCSDGSYYVGSTRNLDLRVSQHQSGKCLRYSSGRLPVEFVYAEEYDKITDVTLVKHRFRTGVVRREKH
jgi:putative endonuclease